MRKTLVIAVITCLFYSLGQAQDNGFGKNVRLGYTFLFSNAPAAAVRSDDTFEIGVAGMLDADLLRLGNGLSFGAHLGLGQGRYTDATFDEIKTMPTYYIGIDLIWHLLETMNREPGMWDLTLRATVGSYICRYRTPVPERGICVGLTFYPNKYVGFYAEAGWGYFNFGDRNWPYIKGASSMGNVGLCYRFGL